MMYEFVNTEIEIPDILECISGQEINITDFNSIKNSKFIIIYYDSLDYSLCCIGHLAENHPLYDMADTYGFPILQIFSPHMDNLEGLKFQLMLTNSPVSIYIYIHGSFRTKNSLMLSGKRFNIFYWPGLLSKLCWESASW